MTNTKLQWPRWIFRNVLVAGCCVLLDVPGACAAPNQHNVLIETFKGGRAHPSKWARGIQPWAQSLGQHAPRSVGGGDQMWWDPAWGGQDPLVPAKGGLAFRCMPLAPTDRAALESAITKQPTIDAALQREIRATKAKCPLIASTVSVPLFGSTFTASFMPGGGRAWTAFWTYPGRTNDLPVPLGKLRRERDTRSELDIGEVTMNADGTMLVRLLAHYTDPAGAWQTLGCKVTLPTRRRITTQALVSPTGSVRMQLDGKDACPAFQLPAYVNVPVQVIFNQALGGASPIKTDGDQPEPVAELYQVRITRERR